MTVPLLVASRRAYAVTLVRHGESCDNIKAVWAGVRDAPLTNHGFAQATRLGKHFAKVPITAIYCSDLKRAHTTASCIHHYNESTPHPPLTVTPLLREQNFGDAEGLSWSEGRYEFSRIPWDSSRTWSFPNGESKDDVALRVRAVLRHFVYPHLLDPTPQQHIVLTAHGIMLDEIIRAIGGNEERGPEGHGFSNTGWARYELTAPSTGPGTIYHRAEPVPELRPQPPHEFASALPAIPERAAGLPPPLAEDQKNPPFRCKTLALNQREHLEGLVRTKGGTGSSAHDENQPRIDTTDFLGGGKAKV